MCKAWTVCGESQYEKKAGTGTSDRVCAEKQCTCTGGNAATGAQCKTHGTEQCTSCTEGAGTYLSDSKCLEWRTCSSAEYMTVEGTTTSNRQCATKQCTCTGGNAATGAQCKIDGTEQCTSCTEGASRYLNNGKCINWSKPCSEAEYQLVVPSTTQNRECATKQCTCTGGTFATGIDCPSHGSAKCTKCDAERFLSGVTCKVCTVCEESWQEQSEECTATTLSLIHI